MGGSNSVAFRIDSSFGRTMLSREANKMSLNLFLLIQIVEIHGMVPTRKVYSKEIFSRPAIVYQFPVVQN